jgi:dUTP pyrophosphatase
MKKTLKVQLHDKKAKTPSYGRVGDAGMDLFTPKKVTVPAGDKVIIDTKVSMELPKNTVALIWDKSGIGCTKGIKVLGGVFDENFRGTFTIGLANLTDKDHVFEEGDKICQVLIQSIEYVNVSVVNKISTTTPRGLKRFGSSGRK